MTRPTRTLLATLCASFALFGAAQIHAEAGRSERPQASGYRPAQGEARPMSAALSLFVHGPTGDDMQLVYLPGNGWRSLDASEPAEAMRKVSAETGPEPWPGPDPSVSGEDPLSVFVDGPTGFVFVWTQDGEAWKFIGTVSQRP